MARRQPRPCVCDNIPPEGEPEARGVHCHRCTLYHRDPRYRKLWSLPHPSQVVKVEAAPAPPEGPGLLTKAVNFAGAVVRHVANGIRYVEAEEAKRRVGICEECKLFNKEVRECAHSKCGCKVDKKAPWSSEHCPDGKW